MKTFDSWFKKKFKDLHDSILCGDLVAAKYKKVSKRSYEAGQQSRQAEIDDLKKRIEDIITSIDWHIEDCELWLSMNKNDSWKGGQLEILKAIKKRFSK